ncbi:CAP domain-containing protein [Bacillaceae bacterium IKA-2]|nr:CAP domain-containing protein [Bacillaceae bacterium IKA-2]
MKIKDIARYVICLFLVVMVGCNINDDQAGRDADNYGGFGARNDQTFDDYRLNEEEQLMGRGQIESQMNSYGTISNANTDIPSVEYPHTKAIQIQQAKYKFVVEGGVKYSEHGADQKPEEAAPVPKQEETPEPEPQTPAPVEQPEKASPEPEQQEKTPTTEGISEASAKVIELTNAERRKNGLSDYQADVPLSNVATVKSDDMQENNYFSHTSPTHGSPFDMIRDHGVSYSAAGENIAQGQSSPEQVVESWMNSEGHRENIMSENFTHIGVGYNKQGHYWTQMFISK